MVILLGSPLVVVSLVVYFLVFIIQRLHAIVVPAEPFSNGNQQCLIARHSTGAFVGWAHGRAVVRSLVNLVVVAI